MIVLDTNVISELWDAMPDPNVLRWRESQKIENLYISCISVAELRFGLEIMAHGKRRQSFEYLLEKVWLPTFAERLLPFDKEATRWYGPIRAHARKKGITIQPADGYIAATAASRNFAIATRDSDFSAAGVQVINPWHADLS